VHIRAARLPNSPLWLRFGRAGAHLKLFGRVVLRGSCQFVRAGRLGATHSGGSFGRVVRANEPVPKNAKL